MTATTHAPIPTTGALPTYQQPQRVTQLRVMRAEWTKLRTQPSAYWALLAAVVLVVGFGIVYSLLRAGRPPHGAAMASFDPAAVSLSGVQLAQIAVGVLGVLLVTSEYASGLIRTTFAAVPRRLPMLWGKATLVSVAIMAVSVPAAFAAFTGGQAILARHHLSVQLSQPGVARAVIGSALYLAVVGLLGLGLGALIRNAAGAIAALFGLLYGLPLAAAFLPGSMATDVTRFLPTGAGQVVTAAKQDPAMLHPWTGFAVLCGYAAVLLAASAARMRRGDA
ncbi:MAG TPA: ABC transporter permease [Streptosporangiaceae bacterium]|nr:ABC transporter permease [Streptosporangiaceae bacterium]